MDGNVAPKKVGRAVRIPVKDKCGGPAHTCRVHEPWGCTTVLQDQLLAGCLRGQAASSVLGGKLIDADCRGVQHNTVKG